MITTLSNIDTLGNLLAQIAALTKEADAIKDAIKEGQEVKAGETLAVVEAMKMENVLKAERDGVVKKIHEAPGGSLAVDQMILEFA